MRLIFCKWIALGVWILLQSCTHTHRNRRIIYMPDMHYSRTYEAQQSLLPYKRAGIFFNAQPVAGTIYRGAFLPNGIVEGAEGYARAQLTSNPYASLSGDLLHKGKALYGIHCAPCHADNLSGDGTLYKGGEGPFPARPATLLPLAPTITDGGMYYVISYGKNMMGAFKNRLSEQERWMIVAYIRSQQKIQ